MNSFAVIILERSIVLQREHLFWRMRFSGCFRELLRSRKFILRESQRVILISSTFLVNFSVNHQFKLFSLKTLYLTNFLCQWFLSHLVKKQTKIKKQNKKKLLIITLKVSLGYTQQEVINFRVVFQYFFINNFRDVSSINKRFGVELFVTKVWLLISCCTKLCVGFLLKSHLTHLVILIYTYHNLTYLLAASFITQ